MYVAIATILITVLSSLVIWLIVKRQFGSKRLAYLVKGAPNAHSRKSNTPVADITSGASFCRLVLRDPLRPGAVDSFLIHEGSQSFRNVTVSITDLAKLDSYANPEYVTTHGFFARKKQYRFSIVGPGNLTPVDGITLPAPTNNRIRLMIEIFTGNREFNQRIQIDTSQVPWKLAQRLQRIRSDGSFVTLYEHVDPQYPLGQDNSVDWN